MTRSPRPLGIAHFSCIDVPPVDFVRLAGNIGYSAVGLRLHPAFPGALFYTLRSGSPEMRSLKAALQAADVNVYDIEFVVIDPTFSPRTLLPMLESAGELGARRLSVCGDDPDEGRLVENLSDLADIAGDFGIGVDLEIMPWRHIGSLVAAAPAVEATGKSNVGVLIDALHLSRSGGRPAALREIPQALIRSVQLCDAPAWRPKDKDALVAEARGGRLLPGAGSLPLQGLLSATPEHATFSVEVPNRGMPPEIHAKALFDATLALFQAHALDSARQLAPERS